jgi:hypothetical protein
VSWRVPVGRRLPDKVWWWVGDLAAMATSASRDPSLPSVHRTHCRYDQLTGEKHLLIAPNSEHSLITGVPEVVESLNTFIHSIAQGKTTRPNFEYTRDKTTGALTVTPTPGFTVVNVTLKHAETLQQERRDFRWVRLASNATGVCKFPSITPPKPIFGGNCLVPIVWDSHIIIGNDGVYTGTPPEPKHKGGWVGYYIEIQFAADTDAKTHYHFTTPGFTWPDTLPFADCKGEECVGTLL